MRNTCEIIADLKDGIDVPYDELKMAALVQSALIFFFQQDNKRLLKGGIGAELVKRKNYSDKETSSVETGYPSWYFKAIKSDPYKYLGAENIPGTKEWESFHGIWYKYFKSRFKEFGE